MAKYVIDGTIVVGNHQKLYGDPENGEIVYLPDDAGLSEDEIDRMVRDGFLRLPADALPAEEVQARLDALAAENAALKAEVADKSEPESSEPAE